MRTLIAFLICSGLTNLQAQNMPAVEQQLSEDFKKIEYWATFNDSAHAEINKYDSLERANLEFRTRLLAFTASAPATINYEFKELEALGLVVRTSDDRLFRIYSWDTRTGGTSRVFETVFQHRYENHVFSKTVHSADTDFTRWYSNIYTLKTENNTYYIGLYHAVFSAKDSYQGVKLFSIDKTRLNEDVRLIKTRTALRGELGFSFNFFSVAKRPERPVKLIYYEEDEKKLSIPVVMEDGKVTKKFVVYQFNGEQFVIVSD